jgi:glycosyltransferase involved in cell wall biosynthesis
MRPLLLNSYDSGGGAAIAAMRLNEALRAAGADSHLMAQIARRARVLGPRGLRAKIAVSARLRLEGAARVGYPQAPRDFSVHVTPSGIARMVRDFGPDLVHLHWISQGMLRIEDLARLGAPLVWTMHDMWAFTGGCHYSGGCVRYRQACGACPQLASTREEDLSRSIWRRKQRSWKDLSIQLVAPSRWLADCARASGLFAGSDVAVIPNTLDTDIFRPRDQSAARARLGLPQNAKLVLFGAIESLKTSRKGAHLLLPALGKLREIEARGIELVVVGASAPGQDVHFPLPVHFAGHLTEEEDLAAYYTAADAVVLPSVEDNLPNVALEALACGRPCAAFNVGGLADLVVHGQTGYLAAPFETGDLAAAIAYCLDDARTPALRHAARLHIERFFAPSVVAAQYLDLYRRVLIKTHADAAAPLP